MEVIPILVLCSLGLVGAALAGYLWSVRAGDTEQADRLSLLPLEEDDAKPDVDGRSDPGPGQKGSG